MATSIEQIQQLYIAFYGHPADPGGQSYWGNILATDPNAIPTIVATFAQSAEFSATFDGKTNPELVTILYQNLFGHAPDSAQLAEWSGRLDYGANLGSVMTGIIGSAAAADASVLDMKVRAATAFTASLDTTAETLGFGTNAGHATAKEYLAYVHDALSLNATTTPFALNLVTSDIVAQAAWSMPVRVDQQVQELYVAYFSRAADAGGHDYWTARLDGNPANPSLALMGGAFASSQEYRDEYAQATNELKVANAYENLFGRAAEPAGVAYWANLMNAGTLTIDAAVTAIAGGAQGTDKYAYGAKVDVAQAITAAIDTPLEAQAYSGTSANAVVAAYIAQVKDVATFNAAIAPAAIDALIASLDGTSGPLPPPPPPVSDDIQLAGIGSQEALAGIF